MSAPSCLIPLSPHALAGLEVDGWRGRCLDEFARAERAVTDALLRFYGRDKAAPPSAPVRLRQMTGQRFEDLAARLEVCAHSPEVQRARSRLVRFREHEAFRPLLCHGQATVFADKGGDWIARLELIELRGGKPALVERRVGRAEAHALRGDLARRAQALAEALGIDGLFA